MKGMYSVIATSMRDVVVGGKAGRFVLSAILLLLVGTAGLNAQTQGNEYRWAAGLLGGATIGVSEGSEVNPAFGLRLHLRYAITEAIIGEVGAGFLTYKDEQGEGLNNLNVAGSVIPVDLRIMLSPWAANDVSPYVFAGFGSSFYSIDEEETPFFALNPGTDVETSGSYLHIPVGGGATFNLTPNFALDVQATNNLGLDDVLNPNTDDENDGLWQFFAGVVYTFGDSGEKDSDGDLLTDEDEEKRGTDPFNPDTDGDGLTDGAEVLSHTTDPLKPDTDGDGLTDGAEINTHGTDAKNRDTDGDDLTDGAEVNTHKTNPLNKDTDADGLADGAEINTHKTDATKADTDGDALSDGDEINRHQTDPKNRDTDGDGLTDGAEVTTHKTRPTEADTDKDGLSDGDEVNRHKTNPNNTDTDAGGVNDGAEIARNINPLDPSDDVTVRETTTIVEREVERTVIDRDKPLVLKGVVFETGKADIRPESETTLNEVLASLRDDNPDVRVEISGHTDNVGSDENNRVLSLNRANSVKAWLVARGIASDRIETKGYGESQPTATNDTPEGRQENRRIEMRRIN